MSIRFPLQTVLDYNDSGNVGAGSVAGGVAKNFTIPQDADNVVVKFTASIVGAAAAATFQTSDDGGTTWYDVARTSIVSLVNNTNAQWLSVPVITTGVSASRPVVGSVLTTIGAAAASTLGSAQFSGLPILGPVNRIFLIYTGNVTTNDGARVQVKVNSQSATA